MTANCASLHWVLLTPLVSATVVVTGAAMEKVENTRRTEQMSLPPCHNHQ